MPQPFKGVFVLGVQGFSYHFWNIYGLQIIFGRKSQEPPKHIVKGLILNQLFPYITNHYNTTILFVKYNLFFEIVSKTYKQSSCNKGCQ